MADQFPLVADHFNQPEDGITALHHLEGPWILKLRYAGSDNITGQPIYPFSGCFLRTGTAHKLYNAGIELQQFGVTMVIWDGYRPSYAQHALWKAAPDPAFVTPPETGSNHTRGAAVDLTLADTSGYLLNMPTDFDDFSEKASVDYPHLPKSIIDRRSLLQSCMINNGFQLLQSEWWHFEDTDWPNYPLFDVGFDQLEYQITRSGS